MQCFEAEATRTFLLALCRKVDPEVKRNEMLLDDVLSAHDIHSVGELYALGQEKLSRMVATIVKEPPTAA